MREVKSSVKYVKIKFRPPNKLVGQKLLSCISTQMGWQSKLFCWVRRSIIIIQCSALHIWFLYLSVPKLWQENYIVWWYFMIVKRYVHYYTIWFQQFQVILNIDVVNVKGSLMSTSIQPCNGFWSGMFLSVCIIFK